MHQGGAALLQSLLLKIQFLTLVSIYKYLIFKYFIRFSKVLKVLLNPKWVFDDSDRAKKVS